jgi:hypothetical protein
MRALQERPIFRVINRLGGALRFVGWKGPTFHPDALERAASSRVDLTDFGSTRYRAPLEALCRAYTHDADLTMFGRVFVRMMLIGLLENRLKIAKALRDDPTITNEHVTRPLFVLGLPRTGTTLLFNLLAQDPACRPLMIWETMQPAPSPRPETYQTDPRIEMAKSRMQRLNQLLPGLQQIHEFPLEGPEECLGLLLNTFTTPFFRGRIPEYREWLASLDDDEVDAAYGEYRRQLQLLQRHVRGGHWILKCPSHLYGLGSLLRTFPDACVVQTHRPLADCVPSLFSLSETIEQLCYCPVDRHKVADTMLNAVGQLLKRGLQGRDAADPDGKRVLDVRFEETVQHPLETVERIYGHFGYSMTAEFRERIEQYLVQNTSKRVGVHHKYTLEDYGVTAAALNQRFAFYQERFA